MRELVPIKESPEFYDAIEIEILKLFREEIYLPLIKETELSESVVKNSLGQLVSAIESGRIQFYRGQFKGRFSSGASKELKKLGAKWDPKQGSWKIALGVLPLDVRQAISVSKTKFERTLDRINEMLDKILPEKISRKLDIEKMFETVIWKVDQSVNRTLKGISVAPNLSPERIKRIAQDYQNNMRLYIQDWTEKEIVRLRKAMQKHTFGGARYEDMVKTIQKSYGVSENKAKFLARQETSLLVNKFKQTRYSEAGIKEYKWYCVAGSKDHQVRPMHKVLEGRIFSWDAPPVTSPDGSRNNPGEDFNCRCYARPIARF